MENEKLVPKLRFSGFEDEWIKVPAGEIFKNVSNKNHDGTLPILAVTQDKGVVPRDSIDFDIKTSEKSVKSYKIIEPGDYVISLRSFQGGIEYSYIKGICSPAYTILKPKKDIYDDFYKFYLKKEEFISRLNYAVVGIRDGKQISYKDFSEIKIPYTSVPEQKQISQFLNTIEKKINMLEKKYQYYRDFKKYLIQQIFTQKLRFTNENNENFDDWEERKLSEFLTEHKLKSTGKEEVYSVSIKKGLVNQVEHLGRTFSAPDTSKYNLVKPGDIVYTKSPTGDFPLGIIKQSRVDKNVIVSPLYGVFTPETYNLGYILNDYFESNVNTHNYLHPIVQKGAKNTMNITNKTFLSKSLVVPVDKEEQNKIANFLMKITIALNSIENQKDKTVDFKKGLLQQIFV